MLVIKKSLNLGNTCIRPIQMLQQICKLFWYNMVQNDGGVANINNFFGPTSFLHQDFRIWSSLMAKRLNITLHKYIDKVKDGQFIWGLIVQLKHCRKQDAKNEFDTAEQQ